MVKKLTAFVAAGLLSGALLSSPSWAETRYITDVTHIPVRAGAGNQFRILHQGIPSGTRVTTLDVSDGGEWTQVRTQGGLEGWLPSQYLIATPTARLQLNQAETRLAEANQALANTRKELSELRAEHQSLSGDAETQAQERDRYAAELAELQALSADAVNLNQRYQDLLTRHEMIQTDFDILQAEHDRLQSDKTINQWLIGAGLVILGMILMLVLPSLKPQKRHSDWMN